MCEIVLRGRQQAKIGIEIKSAFSVQGPTEACCLYKAQGIRAKYNKDIQNECHQTCLPRYGEQRRAETIAMHSSTLYIEKCVITTLVRVELCWQLLRAERNTGD